MSLSATPSWIAGEVVGTKHLHSDGRFIPDLKKAKLVKSLSPNAEIWTLYYELSPVMSPRVFTVLQVKQLSEVDSKREGCALISFSPLSRRLKGVVPKPIASSCPSR